MTTRLLVLAAVLFALVTGCSGGNDPSNGVASISGSQQPSGESPAGDGKTDEDMMREHVKCLQEHGIDAEFQSSEGGEGGGIAVEGGPDSSKEELDAAMEACKHLMPNGGEPPAMDAEQLDKQRELAKCMREHGVNVPDPTAEDPGIRIEGGDKDKVDAAMKACGETPPGGGVKQDGPEK